MSRSNTATETPDTDMPPGEWITVNEACKLAGVHRATIYRWKDAGWLEVVKNDVTGAVRVNRKSLEAVIRRRDSFPHQTGE